MISKGEQVRTKLAPAKRPRIGLAIELQWPYKRHSEAFAGTQNYAQKHGWQCIIDEYAHETIAEAPKKKPPYDGIIARTRKPLGEIALARKIPIVNVWYNSPVKDDVPGVFPDFSIGGKMRAEHLLLRGLRHFATIGAKTQAYRVEADAFERVVAAEGFKCSHTFIPKNIEDSPDNWRTARATLDKLINSWHTPIGVYVHADSVGRLVAQMCEARGQRVPEDVAIITGGNEKTICEYPSPSLTSLDYNYKRVGYEAARLLHMLMEGEPAPTRSIHFPPQGLVVRESTDFMAVDDALVASALSYIAANCHRRIGPDDVAGAVDAETRTLQMRFRKFLDRPIATEIRHIRIERAKRELEHGQKPINEIARDVGFGSSMRMYEVFRRELNISPRDYRKKHNGANEVTGD